MTAKDRRAVTAFLSRVELRIAQERALASIHGIRTTAREAAERRADELARDLDYLRDRYAGAQP